MATGVGRRRICLGSFNSPTPKTPCNTQRSPFYLLYKPSYSRLCSKFRCHGNGGWSSRICLALFNSPTPKTPAIRKDIRDISYTSRVIADFVTNFVAMATVVGRSRICLASFNSPTPKTPCYAQRSPRYLLYKPSYSRFCSKFRCHGNGGWSE